MSVNYGNLVLVVDDNTSNVYVLSTMLKKLGFEVDEATSGMEAINLSCDKQYDLILMDHLMPKMDGIETIRQILFVHKGEKIPKIFGVSATIDNEVIAAFRKVGADDVLEKPVNFENMKNKLLDWGFSSRAIEEEASDKQDVSIDQILSEVKGLDYQKGLRLLAGSVENYMNVLTVCVRNIDDNYKSIEAIRETNQTDGFALYFHSLKGIFLNIGANALADISKQLEMAAKQNQMDEIHSRIDSYMQEVSAFGSSLKQACETYSMKTKEKYAGETVSDSELAEKLDRLMEHIQDFEYIEITEALENLTGMLQEENEKCQKLHAVSDAIQEFDYDKALELVEEMRNDL
ncbi:MAG: response regulator [Clostridiaceae bacterium]|nr:response regulator [Clostridiaceae bacterium]